MTTVHFVYSTGDRLSHPDSVLREVGKRLKDRYKIIGYSLLDTRVIKPNPGDVLVGHPWYQPWSIFRRSARQPGWKRIIGIMPYVHGDVTMDAFADGVVHRCDQFLAITGRYWFETTPQSAYSHWFPKMTQVDLAVERADFPVLKRTFNPPGKRKFLYIGINFWYKNPKFLSAIAKAMPDVEIAWCGSGKPIEGVKSLGRQDFREQAAKELLAQYDFMLTVGNSDANPTTILEAMAWGLIPVCTPQSGYVRYPSIPNVPLDDVEGAVRVLRELQQTPEEKLKAMQQENWRLLDEHFNWDRFAEQVRAAIESNESPACLPETPSRKMQLRWAALRSRGLWARPNHLAHSIYWAVTRRPWRVVEFPTPGATVTSPLVSSAI